MANKQPPTDASSVPQDFPAVAPRDLYDTSDIRFVMRETATLAERIDGLTKAIEKLGSSAEKALEKHAADVKERITDVKAAGKETSDKLGAVKESIDSFKGAMKVFAGIYALALLLGGIFLTWYLRPAPVATVSVAAPPPPPVAALPSTPASISN